MRNLPKHAGFTLIELLMVILIIAATTKIIAVSMQEFTYSARYEQTASRLDSIRQAIIGNPKRTINGQPDISGFVSDMGRLPRNLRELLDQNYCSPDRTVDEQNYNTVTYTSAKDHCDTAYGPNSWKETRNYSACSDAQYLDESDCTSNSETWYPFSSGWNGPYISITDNILDDDAFTDGWGREAQSDTDFDYGWYSCRWNTSADTANSTTANNMPDDTVTADGLPNCITSYATTNQHLSIYSLGKNGEGDVNTDGSVTCGANEYDDDCYTTILEPDYAVDMTDGINVTIKADYSPGTCHYLKTQALTQPNKTACNNLGGATGACKKTTHSTQLACETNNLFWDSDLEWCLDFTQQSSTGTAAADCEFTSSGVDSTEKWGVCVDTIKNQASCTGADDVWWETQGWCIDKTKTSSDSNCTIAGTTGSPALTLKTDFCHHSDEVSCQAGGGDWENCVFSPETSLTTSPPVEACKLTVKSCEKSALGTWDYADGNCIIDDQQPCLAAGGTWTTTCSINSDEITNKNNCRSVGGSWVGTFPQNSTSCSGSGKTWHSSSKYCEFSSSVCNASNGGGEYKAAGVCRRTHSDITASTLTQAICESYGGQEWVTEKKQICMNLFYRNPGDSSFSRIQSYPTTIALDSTYQNIHFTLPNIGNDPVTQAECEDLDGFNDGEWNSGLGQCRFIIANGINAIGIYEYVDSDADNIPDCGPTNPFYPNNRAQPLAIQIIPNTNLPTINW